MHYEQFCRVHSTNPVHTLQYATVVLRDGWVSCSGFSQRTCFDVYKSSQTNKQTGVLFHIPISISIKGRGTCKKIFLQSG